MADNFAQLAAEPRYHVPSLGTKPLTLSQIRGYSDKAIAADAHLSELQKSLERASEVTSQAQAAADAAAGSASAAVAVNTAISPSDTVAPSNSSRGRSRRVSSAAVDQLDPLIAAAQLELLRCNVVFVNAKAECDKARCDVEAASTAASQARDVARAAASIADEIAGSEEFEAVSEEDDSVNGVWSAPAYRFRRKCSAKYRAGIPKCECCNKDYPTTPGFSPGLLVVMCPHRYVYFLQAQAHSTEEWPRVARLSIGGSGHT